MRNFGYQENQWTQNSSVGQTSCAGNISPADKIITGSDFYYSGRHDEAFKRSDNEWTGVNGANNNNAGVRACTRSNVSLAVGTYTFKLLSKNTENATLTLPKITVGGTEYSVSNVLNNRDESQSFSSENNQFTYTSGNEFTLCYTVTISGSAYNGNVSIEFKDGWKEKYLFKTLTIASSAPACTAPNHVDVTPTSEEGNYGWRYSLGETLKLTATAYSSAGTSSPIDAEDITGYQWQKYVGSAWSDLEDDTYISGATTANLQISNLTTSNGGSYRCKISTGASCTTPSDGYFVRIFTLYGGYSGGSYSHQKITWTGEKEGTVTINLNASSTYKFKFTDNNGRWFGNGGTISKDLASNWSWGFGTSDGDATLSTGGYGGGDYVLTVDITHFDDGGSKYVNLRSVVYPKKTTYLQLCSDWKAATAKYAIYYWNGGDNGWTDFMKTFGCDGDIRYADVPVWATNAFFVRFNPSKSSTGDFGDEWNRTIDDLSLSSSYDYYHTLYRWDSDGKYHGSWGTYSPTTYTISFAGNGNTSGSMTDVDDIECEGEVTLEENGYIKTGYTFNGWKDASSNDYADKATINNIKADITLTAQWTPNPHTLTWVLDGGTVTTAGTQANVDDTGSPSGTVNYGETVTAPTVIKTGYNFSAWSPAVVSPMPDADKTYTATWTVKTTTITIDANTSYHGSTSSSVTATWGSVLPPFEATEGEDGYGLIGYYTGANDGTKVINADGTLVQNVTGYTSNDATPVWIYETSTLDLYPHYDPLYTVTVNDDGNGSGEADKAAYFAGETVTITATPSSGYIFDEWTTSDGVSFASSTTSPTTFTMPSSNVTVQANFEEKTCSDTRVIQCEDYDPDITKPSRGHDKPGNYRQQGKGIDGDDGGYGDAYGDAFASFRDSGNDKEIFYNIYLPAATYTFTVRCANGGLKKVVLYNAAGDEKLQELELGNEWTNNSWYNYTTSSWTASSSDNYYIGLRAEGQWAVFDQMTITANSDVFCQFTVSATATNGSVTGTGTYYAGETVSLTPSADPGYEFTAWSSLSGVTVSGYEDDNPLTFTMPDNAVSVTASFETSCTPHDITLTNDGHGSATASPTSACEGDAVSITASPNTGYHFHYWSTSDVDISGHENDNPLAITMPDGDISVAAHFLRSIIATGDANLGTHTGYADKNASMSVSNVDDPASKFDHKVLQITYTMNSADDEASYYGMSLPVDAGYTTSIASGKAGMGFWYRTASTNDQVLMYFCIGGTDGSHQFESLLPATNQKWQYWYIATDYVDDNTTFGFYINGTKNGKSSGVIGSSAKVWLSEVEPLTPADVTVDDGEPEEIAPVVRDLTIYQGSEVSNAADVIVTGSIAYHRHAKGGALTNKLDQWYTFAVPFTVSGIEVKESSTWYDVNAVHYTTNGDQSSEPDGPGHFYLQYLKNDTKNQMTNDRWMYINPAHSEYIDADTEDWDGYRYGYPKKDSAYIILFDSTDPIGNYFETNTEIRFVGGPQTIASTAWTPDYDVEETEYWMYANNTLHSITLTNDAYVLNESGTMFVLEEEPTIRPFECYIQATEEFKLTYASIPMRRPGGNTPTAIEDIELNDTSRTIKVLHQGHLIIIRNGHSYDFMGARVH